jgi:excinuclease ABC subunit B
VAAYKSLDDIDSIIGSLKKEMTQAAKDLEFEKAAELRDEIKALQKLIVLEA